MGPVSAEVEIDVSRGRAFEAIADLALRSSFTDHFLADFHLTRIESTGAGAGARFRIAVWPRDVWMDTTIIEADAPHRLVEHGQGGRVNRIPSTTLWELTEGPGSLTKVRVSFWTEPSNPVDRGLELLSGASIPYERRWREALQRLREQLESDQLGADRVAVAGGNPHATGIP
ncbi:MAG: SRPBCC family protein [Solirubrobacterales bacterium]